MGKDKDYKGVKSEEKIILSGIAITFLIGFSTFIISFFDGAMAAKIVSVITTHILSGRAGGIATGVELDLPFFVIAPLSTLIDSTVVLLVYPLFVLISKKRIENQLINRVLIRTKYSVRKHKKEIGRFGLIGLLLFVWFPLHMTGPLAGSILGYFLGFSHKKTLTAVIIGTALAVISWLFIFRKLNIILGRFSFITPVTIILISLGLFFLYKIRRDRRKR